MAPTLLWWRANGCARLDEQSPSLLRGQLGSILLGTVFLFVGLNACVIATVRRRGEFRILEWFGWFIGMYGARMLVEGASALGVVPKSGWPAVLIVTVDYLLVVPSLLFWAELGIGNFRRLSQAGALVGAAIGIAGLGVFSTTGSPHTLLAYNHLLAIFMLLVVGIVAAVPRLSRKFLVIQSRVLGICMPVIAGVALCVNLAGLLGFRPPPYIDPLPSHSSSFRLHMSPHKRSLPTNAACCRLRMNWRLPGRYRPRSFRPVFPKSRTSYRPMAAVAGGFYEFILLDQHRLGVLVADVSGHGVPAALIASMIKVAVQSVVSCAHDPAEVLGRLNRILSGQLRNQFVSAAFLWVDMEIAQALYSAAGHPALLCWREGKLQHIESNGLLFGVAADADYRFAACRSIQATVSALHRRRH